MLMFTGSEAESTRGQGTGFYDSEVGAPNPALDIDIGSKRSGKRRGIMKTGTLSLAHGRAHLSDSGAACVTSDPLAIRMLISFDNLEVIVGYNRKQKKDNT